MAWIALSYRGEEYTAAQLISISKEFLERLEPAPRAGTNLRSALQQIQDEHRTAHRRKGRGSDL